MGSIKYNKLVRDKIPQIIEGSGKTAVVETLDNEAYKRLLDVKLEEELQEYLASDNVEELADLVEVVYAILKYKDVDLDTFENIRLIKAAERGAFDKRILLKEVLDK
jgi:predicted house-cleaning noncanonical NTP pyrophosphatase (MazG superfamily)